MRHKYPLLVGTAIVTVVLDVAVYGCAAGAGCGHEIPYGTITSFARACRSRKCLTAAAVSSKR